MRPHLCMWTKYLPLLSVGSEAHRVKWWGFNIYSLFKDPVTFLLLQSREYKTNVRKDIILSVNNNAAQWGGPDKVYHASSVSLPTSNTYHLECAMPHVSLMLVQVILKSSWWAIISLCHCHNWLARLSSRSEGKHLICTHWGIVFWALLRQNTAAKCVKVESY